MPTSNSSLPVEVHLIMQVPLDTAVTLPEASATATELSVLLHDTSAEAFAGVNTALSVALLPCGKVTTPFTACTQSIFRPRSGMCCAVVVTGGFVALAVVVLEDTAAVVVVFLADVVFGFAVVCFGVVICFEVVVVSDEVVTTVVV